MTDEQDTIANAERENDHDRPKDAIGLLCRALVVQHRAFADLAERVRVLEERLPRVDAGW